MAHLARVYGAEVDYIDLPQASARLCLGCIACYRTAKCCISDGVEELAQRVRESDGVVIGSPTHGSNVSAILKNFLDRGHFLLERALLGKYGLSLATEEIADGRQVLRVLDKFLLVGGAHRSGRFLLKLDFNSDPFAKSSTRRALHRELDRLVQDIERRSRQSLFERLFGWLLVRVVWRPVFLRSPEKYAGVLQHWRERGILEAVQKA
jgi:NAD(P)H-dependent FMN reductase